MRTLVIASTSILVFVGVARASDVRSACMPDVKTMCAGVTPGEGRIRACMRAHHAEVSDGCKVALADRMLAREHPVRAAK